MERDSWNSFSLEKKNNLIFESKGERNHRGDGERAERTTTDQFTCVRGRQGFFFLSFVAANVLLGTRSSLFLEPLLPCQGVGTLISFLTETWQPFLINPWDFSPYTLPPSGWLMSNTPPQRYYLVSSFFSLGCLSFFRFSSCSTAELSKLYFPCK